MSRRKPGYKLGVLFREMIDKTLGDTIMPHPMTCLAATATKPVKQTAERLLVKRLAAAEKPLAVHEFNIYGHSENSLATAVSILARKGMAFGVIRPGFKYKEWSLTPLWFGLEDK